MAEASASGVGGFIGNSVGEAAAFAAGLAIGPLLEPYLQELKNTTWQGFPSKPLDAALMAQGVAEYKIGAGVGENEAGLTGIGKTPFGNLVAIFRQAPGIPSAFDLIRRGQLDKAGLLQVLQRAALENDYLAAYQKTGVNGLAPWEQPLDPSAIALGIVRSTLPGEGFLVVNLDTSGSNVKQYTPANIDVTAEAAASGVSAERLRTMVGNVGLPLASIAAAQAQFRGIITKGAYYQAILEGDTRPEWADPIYEYAREILTAHDGVELRLRGWLDTDQQMYDLTARHGMSTADTDLLYKVLGRPMSHHQVFLAERRGGVYDVTPPDIDPAFLKSLRESNERPEWYGLEWAARFSQPSVFVVRQFLKDGGDPAWAQTKLFYEGWEQSDIDIFIAEYTKQAAATANPVLKSQHTAAITAARKAYLAGNLANTVASEQLQALGQTADDAARILAVWDIMYEIENSLPPGSGGPH